ncbi:hypothetical protein LTR37_001571 [Vermiconidia calcicola]|uniref:Uncharacterized protein n=1 Tax=Vermiconidia calcicola TaxID=1690605 RepID=A0ACC3NV85_9PEZI|nr:hypothetical protein LTR37_001571 [Vermiconidia calcicola]
MSSSPPSLPWEVIFLIFNHLLPVPDPPRLIAGYRDTTDIEEALYPFSACKTLRNELARLIRDKVFTTTVDDGLDKFNATINVEHEFLPYIEHISITMRDPVEDLMTLHIAEFQRYIRTVMRTLPALASIHVSFFGDATWVHVPIPSPVWLPRPQPKEAVAVAIHALQLGAAGRLRVTVAMTDDTAVLPANATLEAEAGINKEQLVQLMVNNIGSRYEVTRTSPVPDTSDDLWTRRLVEGQAKLPYSGQWRQR